MTTEDKKRKGEEAKTLGYGTISSPGVCTDDHHVYPTTYAGDPQYANEYFSHCLCGKKRKVTTVKEVDTQALNLSIGEKNE